MVILNQVLKNRYEGISWAQQDIIYRHGISCDVKDSTTGQHGGTGWGAGGDESKATLRYLYLIPLGEGELMKDFK